MHIHQSVYVRISSSISDSIFECIFNSISVCIFVVYPAVYLIVFLLYFHQIYLHIQPAFASYSLPIYAARTHAIVSVSSL